MSDRYTHDQFKKKLLKKKSVKRAYDDLEAEYNLKRELIRARIKAGMTQENVAEAMNTTKSSISRLEALHASGSPSPSIRTLEKYADAVDCKIIIRVVAKKPSRKKSTA